MKTFWQILGIGVVGSLCLGTFNSQATLEVAAAVQINSRADFYAPLTPHGTWVEVRSYGRCWRPASVAVEWRPYTDGYWVWTDCGWYWQSDEPWGWACYHYGHWIYDSDYGWIWVPDVVWGPAWVSWRVGGGYVGWAPLPPPGVTVHVAAPALFVFVESTHFTKPIRPKTVIVNNTTIIKQTTVINNIKEVDRTIAGSGPRKVMFNEGPGIDPIQKVTGKRIDAVPIRNVVRQTSATDAVKEKSVPPSVREQPEAAPKPEPPIANPESRPNEVVPRLVQPQAPLANPAEPSEGKGKGPGHDKNKNKP